MDTNPAWYAKGLRFECTSCGRCCTGSQGYVWVTFAEAEKLAAHLLLSLQEFGVKYLRSVGTRYALLDQPGGDCIFLRGKVCSVYEARPRQCRSFPWWPAHLQSAASWAHAAVTCEGIRDDAPVVASEDIERSLSAAIASGVGYSMLANDARGASKEHEKGR
jgi:uncharacterized protein